MRQGAEPTNHRNPETTKKQPSFPDTFRGKQGASLEVKTEEETKCKGDGNKRGCVEQLKSILVVLA